MKPRHFAEIDVSLLVFTQEVGLLYLPVSHRRMWAGLEQLALSVTWDEKATYRPVRKQQQTPGYPQSAPLDLWRAPS